jgi:hypothetical protein
MITPRRLRAGRQMSGARAPYGTGRRVSSELAVLEKNGPAALSLPAVKHMLPRAALVTAICVLAGVASVGAAQYKVVIKRLDDNRFQAQASRVIIETRRCDWFADGEEDEAILNWEGSFGNNWILFTASNTRCDVAAIR